MQLQYFSSFLTSFRIISCVQGKLGDYKIMLIFPEHLLLIKAQIVQALRCYCIYDEIGLGRLLIMLQCNGVGEFISLTREREKLYIYCVIHFNGRGPSPQVSSSMQPRKQLAVMIAATERRRGSELASSLLLPEIVQMDLFFTFDLQCDAPISKVAFLVSFFLLMSKRSSI